MSRKASWNLPSLPALALKVIALILVTSALCNVIYFINHDDDNNTASRIQRRNVFSASNPDEVRECELNRRLVMGLRERLAERDEEIRTHKETLKAMNRTNEMLKVTLRNLTSALKPTTKVNDMTSSMTTSPMTTLPFPGDFKEKIQRVSRPCCLALKRMTDILRVYMEKEQDLKDEIKYYQQLNYTQPEQPTMNEELRAKVTKANCTRTFHEANKQWLVKTSKHGIYQTYRDGFFYESLILNRDIPKQKAKSKTHHRTLDFNKVTELTIAKVARDTQLPKHLFSVEEALLRYDELSGAEYKLTLNYTDTTDNSTRRRFLVNVIKPFASHMLTDSVREEPGPRETRKRELINIIVPITGRATQLSNFLRDLYHAAILPQENIYLTVVIYGKDPDNHIKQTVRDWSKENNFGNYDVLKKDKPFNRGRALHDGIMRWNGEGNVLFFLCDIDIKFNNPFLNRCRKYAERGRSVYMPIVFSLYNPNIVFGSDEVRVASKALNISDKTGTWRPLGYGMVCTYKKDYVKSSGFNLNINGWGGEDVSLYHR